MSFFNRRKFEQDRFIHEMNGLRKALFSFLKNDKKIIMSAHPDFYMKISTRVEQFEAAYQKAGNSVSKKNEVIKQYNHYLQTWKNCLNEKDARFVGGHISFYHAPTNYNPIGCFDYHKPSTTKKIACGATILLGVLGVVGGIVASPFCLFAGVPLIAASVITILTATLVLVGSKYLKDDEFKKEEKELFEDGVNIVQEIACKESANSDEFNSKETLRKRVTYS